MGSVSFGQRCIRDDDFSTSQLSDAVASVSLIERLVYYQTTRAHFVRRALDVARGLLDKSSCIKNPLLPRFYRQPLESRIINCHFWSWCCVTSSFFHFDFYYIRF